MVFNELILSLIIARVRKGFFRKLGSAICSRYGVQNRWIVTDTEYKLLNEKTCTGFIISRYNLYRSRHSTFLPILVKSHTFIEMQTIDSTMIN